MAKDVLAMLVSTVASESSFSTGGRVLNQYRSSLSPKTVEAPVCAQNWFRSTPIATDIEELLADLEKLEQDMESIPGTELSMLLSTLSTLKLPSLPISGGKTVSLLLSR
ncbi:hypothetical protein RJT34_14185 [Clitoria ternatea]|uniref:HAT C-terminal dimerisation domain-containing protein n=1 Tax=Clitoria ternatea TaxID=43366 RepID=A0AAN9JQ79_CLITE